MNPIKICCEEFEDYSHDSRTDPNLSHIQIENPNVAKVFMSFP
jgi:hypothetical protein